jgi:hypothetical protein
VKVVAGYVGSIAVFKRLIEWNIIDFPLRTKLRVRHINHHGYMRRVS